MTDERPSDDDAAAGEGADDGSRRQFIKKLTYVAPVIQIFLLNEGVLASGQQRGKQRNQRRRQRRQRGISPHPGQGKPPPPPPHHDDDDD